MADWEDAPTAPQGTILAPAVKTPDGVKVGKVGDSHDDIGGKDTPEQSRGFVDSKGNFLDREQAAKVAQNAGLSVPDKLHSEHLAEAAGKGWEDAPSPTARFMAGQTQQSAAPEPWWKQVGAFLRQGGKDMAAAEGPYKSPAQWAKEGFDAAAASNARRHAEYQAWVARGMPRLTADEIMNSEAGKLGQFAAAGFAPGEGGMNALGALERGAGVRPAAVSPAEAANRAGYVLPPAMASDKPGMAANTLAAVGGKVKLAQEASTRNQEVTNTLAVQSLGLPKDTMLTDGTFKSIREKASKAYKDIATSVPAIFSDAEFKSAVGDLGQRSSLAAQHFPGLMKNEGVSGLADELAKADSFPPQAGLDLVRKLRADATSNLKAFGDPEKQALGLAQRKAADAVDGLIERNLGFFGKPELVPKYRAARQLIAKTHDLESVTNTATGDVDARGLARLADKGRPLTGELKTISDAASSFPKAFQRPSGFGGDEPYSAIDAYAAALALSQGRAEVLGAILGRPMARDLALSRLMQNSLTRPRLIPPPNSLRAIAGAP